VVRADSLTGEAVTRIPPCEYSFLEPWTVDCRHVAYADCQAAQPGIDEIEFTVKDASLYSCGFDPPLSDPAVRAWPLQAILPMSMYIHDADTMLVTGADILPPVVTVAFADEAGERSNVAHLTSAAGQATTGTHSITMPGGPDGCSRWTRLRLRFQVGIPSASSPTGRTTSSSRAVRCSSHESDQTAALADQRFDTSATQSANRLVCPARLAFIDPSACALESCPPELGSP
jgi:hypothetical protein